MCSIGLRSAYVGLAVVLVCGLAVAGRQPIRQANQAQASKPSRVPKAVPSQSQLKEAGSIAFSAGTPQAVRAWMACSEGSVFAYFEPRPPSGGPATPVSLSLFSLWRISLDSQTVTRYPPPTLTGYQLLHLNFYNVGPRGGFYALYDAYKHANDYGEGGPADSVIVKFNDDGSVGSQSVLSGTPSGRFEPRVFEVFGNGYFLVAGALNTYSKPESGPQPRFVPPEALPKGVVGHRQTWLHPLIGIFDQSGHFLQKVNPSELAVASSNPAPQGSASEATPTTRGAPGGLQAKGRTARNPWNDPIGDATMSLMVAAPDGDIYLLLPSSPAVLYQILADGQILHEARVESPAGGFHPLQMSAAGNSAFITFGGITVDKKGRRHSAATVAVVDAGAGKTTAIYERPQRLGIMGGACANSPNELLFLGSSADRHLEIFKYQTN